MAGRTVAFHSCRACALQPFGGVACVPLFWRSVLRLRSGRARAGHRSQSRSFNRKIDIRIARQSRPRSRPTIKKSVCLLPSKASRSVRTSPPALPAWCSGRSFLRWIFRIRPARKSLRSRVASNTSRPWQSRDVLPPRLRNLCRLASADGVIAKEIRARELCRAALRDRCVAQRVGRKAAVLALRSIKPSALDNLFSVGGHADDGHRHPRTPGFQLDRIPDLKRHCRPRIPSFIRLAL